MYSLLHSTFMNGPLQKSDISFVIEEAGRPFLSHQADLPLTPASNMKLAVTAAALLAKKEILPSLQTYATGKVDNGHLHGDLVLDSCGSPIFTARFPVDRSAKERNNVINNQLRAYLKQLQSVKIKSVQGDLKLSFKRWNGAAENSHYTAAAAFAYNENTVDTFCRDGDFSTVPQSPLVFNFATNTSVASQDKVANNLIRYNPQVDSQDYWRISNSSALEYSRLMLKRELQKAGISFMDNKVAGVEGKLLFETVSCESVGEFIRPLNRWSDNYRAEILALQLARAYSGRAKYSSLNKALHSVYDENGFALKSLIADDGSGLSRKNRISAQDINELLKFMGRHKKFPTFLDSLAVAGKSGTLRKRFKGTPFEGKFYGKTGTLDGVSALSGYWLRDKRPPITFSFIGNGAENKLFWRALEDFAASMQFLT
jgi:serine-type D-Ala-D-Ala carboxypeptidase/endopeptidase (penicillin-binding protein 4)